MTNEKIARINELARKSKTMRPLPSSPQLIPVIAVSIINDLFIIFKRQPFPRTLRGIRHLGNLVPPCQAATTAQV